MSSPTIYHAYLEQLRRWELQMVATREDINVRAKSQDIINALLVRYPKGPPPSNTITSVNARLPPEITDMIIAFVGNDRSTLASCAAVCKAWVSASQFMMFGGAIADGISTYRDLECDLSLNSKGIKTLVELLGSPHCNLSRNMRYLRFYSISGTLRDDALVLRLRKLRNVRRLDFGAIGFRSPLLPAFTSHFARTVHVLRLDYVSCGTELLALIEGFPLLDALCIGYVHIWDYSAASTSTLSLQQRLERVRLPSFRPALRVLQLPACTTSVAILQWVLSHPSPCVTDFRVDLSADGAHVAQVRSFIAALGTSLEHLVVIPPPNEVCDLSLSHNTKLRILDFGGVVHVDDDSPEYIARTSSRSALGCSS
ncbi:hypothetical protein PLICRDRAFT_701701 [Plicaturopsis crispa FD-325 SS-3]|uniref:F-box domain-containing protein n=1 Tax=Plicaturopsis crispa FD-325 SS-3 TaxID=944288 RepID=A0A0C9T8H7_PLICR|nr:hypothetical protein PLICRDRAFT_701701 [Plicaturopsis crispa FD-325 SS-3]